MADKPDSTSPSGSLAAVEHVVWDADGTLWNWTRMMAPAWQALHASLAQNAFETSAKHQGDEAMGDESFFASAIRASMQSLFEQAGTMDISHLALLREIPLLHEALEKKWWSLAEHDHIRDEASLAFRMARNQNRHLAPGIQKTIRHLSEAGKKQYIVSDAPMEKMMERVRRFGIVPAFDRIYAQQDPFFRPKTPDEEKRCVQIAEKKPAIRLDHLIGISRRAVTKLLVVIGDNPEKDVALAAYNRCAAILAQWAKATRDEIQLLLELGSANVVSRNVSLSENLISILRSVPTGKMHVAETVDRVSELLLPQAAG